MLILGIVVLFAANPKGVYGNVETIGNGFSISVSPPSGFLRAPNMAPGDSVTAALTVYNDGQHDFVFDISAVKESGSDPMFRTLDLLIDDSEGVIYSGKLSECKNTMPRIIGRGGNRVVNFTVSLPTMVNNTYQDLTTGVTFVFNATEHSPCVGRSVIIWDPPLEKPDVNCRQGTIMPIRFHLIRNGTIDTVKRDIDLYITGIYRGKNVKYKFSVADGTLKWEARGLEKPHYVLLFDTRCYPVDPDTYYTATAKLGDQVLGSTRFKSGPVNRH